MLKKAERDVEGFVDLLEQDLGVPVVHPVTARVWEFQKRLHENEAREGYGVLLSDLPPLA